MGDPAEPTGTVISSLKRLLCTVLSIAQNRLELVLVEAQEERNRVFEAFLLLAAVVAFGAMALVMITCAVVVVFWEDHGVAALLSLGLLYLGLTLGAYWRLQRRMEHWPAFSATLAELKKDKAWWDEHS